MFKTLFYQRNLTTMAWIIIQQIIIFVSQTQLTDSTPENFVKGASANLLAAIALMASFLQIIILENGFKNLRNASTSATGARATEAKSLLTAGGMSRIQQATVSTALTSILTLLATLAVFIACFKALKPTNFNIAVSVILGIYQLAASIYNSAPCFACCGDERKVMGEDEDLERGLSETGQKQLAEFSWLYYAALNAAPNLLVIANVFLFNGRNEGALIAAGVTSILAQGSFATVLTLPTQAFNLPADRFFRLLAVIFSGISVAGIAYKGYSPAAEALLILSSVAGILAPVVSIRCCGIEYKQLAPGTVAGTSGTGYAKAGPS